MATESVKISRGGCQEFEMGNKKFTVDVFDTHAKIRNLNHLEDEVEWFAAMKKLIEDLGGPGDCTSAECSAFNNHIVRLTKELSSFFVPSASPQPSTAST